jgi:hypothetical protein
VGCIHPVEGEPPRVEDGTQLAGVDEGGGLPQDLAVVLTTPAGEQRQQSKDPGVGRPSEGQRGEGVGAPSERAHDVTGPGPDRLERVVEHGAAHGVVDDVESLAQRVQVDVLVHGGRCAVDRGRTQIPDGVETCQRTGGDHPRPSGKGELDDHVPDAAGTAMDQNRLSHSHPGPVDQTLPRGDRDQWQGGGLPHG